MNFKITIALPKKFGSKEQLKSLRVGEALANLIS